MTRPPRPIEAARARADVLRRESDDLTRTVVTLSAMVATDWAVWTLARTEPVAA